MSRRSSPAQPTTEGVASEIIAQCVSKWSIFEMAASNDHSGVPHIGWPTFAANAFAQNGGIMWVCTSIRLLLIQMLHEF